MKILDVKSLVIPEIQVIRFARFRDPRGYFTELFRKSDFQNRLPFMKDAEFGQCNESCSKSGTVRGLHFQWNPYMGKLVRTLSGHMIDMVLDIRKGSPTFGKIIGCDMPSDPNADFAEWIWVPPGFAHGNFFTEPTLIEYFCTGEYNPACEAGISPLAADIDWSCCERELKKAFDTIVAGTPLITDKDRDGYSLAKWLENPNSDHYVYRS